jgi:hypothetical protein
MKKVFLSLSFLFVWIAVFGQTENLYKNAINVGINAGFFGSGDFYMAVPYVEYSHTLKPWIAITPRFMFARSSKQDEVFFNIKTFVAPAFLISLTPFPRNFNRFKVHIGGVYSKLEQTSGNVPNPEYHIGSYAQYYRDDGFGFIGSLSYNFLNKKKAESGLRFDMLTSFDNGYFNCVSMQLGVYFGFKF